MAHKFCSYIICVDVIDMNCIQRQYQPHSVFKLRVWWAELYTAFSPSFSIWKCIVFPIAMHMLYKAYYAVSAIREDGEMVAEDGELKQKWLWWIYTTDDLADVWRNGILISISCVLLGFKAKNMKKIDEMLTHFGWEGRSKRKDGSHAIWELYLIESKYSKCVCGTIKTTRTIYNS